MPAKRHVGRRIQQADAKVQMNILIVEDQFLIATLMADTLADAGHHVLGPAAAQREALEALAGAPLDLALVDVELRGGDSGIIVARELRRRGVPTIFVSAQASVARANRNLAIGFVAKPYMPRVLLDVVRWVQAARAGTPATRVPVGFELFDVVFAPAGKVMVPRDDGGKPTGMPMVPFLNP